MKIAVITGASSGMGREMVTQLADRFGGLDEIWVIARRKERLLELKGTVPITLRVFGIDITDEKDRRVLEDALKTEQPNVKFLVNAAGYGMIGRVGSLLSVQEEGMVKLNCQALCAITHMVLPYVSDNSRIIQFASSASFLPQPGFAIYAATKAFVLSYSRALGVELKKRDIYVTAVCPGPVKTEFFDIAETTGKIPLYKRLAMADARKVTALALKDSMMGKPVSVYGILMKLFHVTSKVIPHGILLKCMEIINR